MELCKNFSLNVRFLQKNKIKSNQKIIHKHIADRMMDWING